MLPPAVIDAALAEMDALYDNDEKPTGIIGYPTGSGFEGVFQHPHLEAAACDVLHADAVELVSGRQLLAEAFIDFGETFSKDADVILYLCLLLFLLQNRLVQLVSFGTEVFYTCRHQQVVKVY